jgi:hypothetical protein
MFKATQGEEKTRDHHNNAKQNNIRMSSTL